MSDLKIFFTKTQVQKLQFAGFHSLYQLITYIPFDLFQIQALTQNTIVKDGVYLADLKILGVEFQKKRKSFLKITVSLKFGTNLVLYSFNTSSWLLKILKPGNQIQAILENKNGLWNLQKAVEKSIGKTDKMELGKAEMKNFLEVKYTRIGSLTSLFFKKLHTKLPAKVYKINLKGLIPENSIIPTEIDLYPLHFPKDQQEFWQTKKQWLAFKVFLKMALNQFMFLQTNQKFAFPAQIEPEFLRNLASGFDFDLSASQKLSIWDILSGVNLSSLNTA